MEKPYDNWQEIVYRCRGEGKTTPYSLEITEQEEYPVIARSAAVFVGKILMDRNDFVHRYGDDGYAIEWDETWLIGPVDPQTGERQEDKLQPWTRRG